MFFITDEKGDGGCREEKGGEVLEAEEEVRGEIGQAGLVVVPGVGECSWDADQKKMR